MSLLEVKEISCQRSERLLFMAVNLQVNNQDIVQIVGENGVGKTSLLRILSGLLLPNTGEIFWQQTRIDKDFPTYWRDIFYLGHERGIKENLTVYENLRFDLRCQNAKQEKIRAILSIFKLENFTQTLCGKLSQGQQLRVALAKLLLVSAKLWILDEPFSTLDEEGITVMKKLMGEHITAGGSVILTTHRPITLLNQPLRTLQLDMTLRSI